MLLRLGVGVEESVFEEGPLCDLCRKLYASDDVDVDALPLGLRRYWDQAAETNEVVCSGCLEILKRCAKMCRLPSNIQSLRDYKVVDCPACRKKRRRGLKTMCFDCGGLGKRLIERSPLERLADAADDLY